MDDAMMSRLMQSYGASNNAANANRVREFGASNPDVLERRAMGVRGSGNEDNSDLLGPLLEKLMAQTDGVQQQPLPPPSSEQQPLPTVQNATAPTRRSATAAPVAPNRQANYGMQDPPGAVNPLDPQNRTTPPASSDSGFWNDLLRSLLGITSVAGTAAVAGAGNRPQKAQPRAVGEGGAALENPFPDGQKRLTYEPKLEDKRSAGTKQLPDDSGKKMPSGAPELDQKGVNVERTKMLQPEIDAENAQVNALQEQMRRRAAEEASTADLIKKAKRAVGRK